MYCGANGVRPEMRRNGGKMSKTPLNRQQITGFWAAWAGWMLDGMDSFIYALVLAPAMRELLPKSGFSAAPANVAYTGSLLFGLFLVGWGLSFIWGPVADRFGRTRTLAGTVLIYSVFTGAAALAGNVWELAAFRFLAGIGIGGEWAMAGTYVAEAWPEDRRRQGAGYLQTGYYAGFFVAAVLNATVGAHFGWRAMFLCGLAPVVVSIVTLLQVKEPARWQQAHDALAPAHKSSLARILSGALARRTWVNTVLVAVAIIGLWAGAVYEPTAVIKIATAGGAKLPDAQRMASYATGLLSIGTILGCLVLPGLADRIGRRWTMAVFFAGMAATITASFGWAYYLPPAHALPIFMTMLFFLGFFGGNFALFSLWLPEQYGTNVRATAFAFCTSIGRFAGAGVNFALAWGVQTMGTLGTPVALTAIAFALGILVVPLAVETRGEILPG
jgi:MFS family permease